ncbi:DUF883 domain-containing protein [Uliginosibacterium sp. H3]|uniref:DUF883 domain-containing protein n=1 Tax=Uliginosibacterium silvisoli TaxID=3114758 RepID=A0ABU6JZH0_9RHOO|nr:DUF883 domain-containing protein [Uliginosibacterium sp. H3]
MSDETSTSTLIEESQDILRQTEALMAEAVNATGEEAKALQARVVRALERAKLSLGEAEKAALAKAGKAAKATDTYVRDNPWKAVGLGAAIGVVVGMLIARR